MLFQSGSSIVDGEARPGPAAQPDVILEADTAAFYYLFVERRWEGVTVEGDRSLLERLLEAAAPPADAPVPGEPAMTS